MIIALWFSYINNIGIQRISLSSPNNSALFEDIAIDLSKSASVYIKYWKEGGDKIYRTNSTKKTLSHLIHLVLLEPNTTYKYQLIVDRWLNSSSEIFSFHTRDESVWLKHDWIKYRMKNDTSALSNGMVLLCYAGKPGYIAMVDETGVIRWYWQVDDIGVKIATITPRGTILALLHSPQSDEKNNVQNKTKLDVLSKSNYPFRRGGVGFNGGTSVAEIDLFGKTLWRLNLDSIPNQSKISFHHDLRMDNEHNIVTLIHDPLPYDLSKLGGNKVDTLWGDALLKLDTSGKILWKWSPWDTWNFKDDKKLNDFSYDRFHFNSVWIDKNGDYLVSSAIESQIWKINAKTKKVMWKLGQGGDFKMDTSDYFKFQHTVNITRAGDFVLFDNGDTLPFDTVNNKVYIKKMNANSENKISRVLSFQLDTVTMKASTLTKINLPPSKFSSRMGSAYELPNNTFLVTSSKTGSVFVINKQGSIVWELVAYFIPYRAEYVSSALWDKYFTIINN